MALSIVQQTSGRDAGGGVNSFQLAYSSNVTSGNLLVVAASWSNGNNAGSISDTIGHTWNALTRYDEVGNGISTQIWWVAATSSAANTVTVTIAGAAIFGISMNIYEVNASGGGTWSLDGTPTGTSGNSANPSVGSLAVSSGSFAVCHASIFQGTTTNGSGWTLDSNISNGFNVATESQVPTSAGTLTGNFTNASSTVFVGGVAAWKVTASSGGVTKPMWPMSYP